MVGHFNHFFKSTSILKKVAIEYKENRTILVQRVPTRWNSDLKQLKSILDLEECLAKMAETLSVIEDLMPNNDEIHIMKAIVECLDPIDKISICLISDQGPTINLVTLKIYNLKKRLDQIDNRISLAVVTKVAEAVLVRFENRFPDCGNRVIEYSMSHFLDPRYKVQLSLQSMRQGTRM